MAEIVWSEPALGDLDAIADYIALEDPAAASALVTRIFGHVEQLADHPRSGSRPQELGRSRYRQIVEPPCRVIYRYDGHQVFILHVMRSERVLRRGHLGARARRTRKRIDDPITAAPSPPLHPHFRTRNSYALTNAG